jgi:hypothetical protein
LFSRAVGATPGKKHYKIKYEGKVFGRAIQGVVWELEEEEPRLDSRASILTAALKGEGSENKSDVLMILSESLQEIRVYEKNAGKNIKFYSLKRID